MMIRRVGAVLVMLASWHYCLAQWSETAGAKGALKAASEGQRRVLAQLHQILKDEKAELADGVIMEALRGLLHNESK